MISTGGIPSPSTQPGSSTLFTRAHVSGRGVAVPCDASGQVDLDTLTERLRNAYLGARAMVGREYACPRVQPAH